jgi:predicted permease
MNDFAVIAAFLVIGMALRRIRAVPGRTGSVLNQLVISVCIPAIVLLKIPRMAFSGAVLVPAITPWAMLTLSAAAVILLSKALRWDRPTTGCMLLMVPLGNTSFLGFPMVKAFFGDAAIPYALLYDQLGSFPMLGLYGTLIVSVYGSGEGRPSPAAIARKVLVFPPFLALLLAIALREVPYPPAVVGILTVLSSALVPLVMTALGFQLDLRMGKEQAGLIGLGLSIKMAAAPLAALAACRLLGLEGDAARVSVFEAGMPPMISAGALAIAGNLSPSLTAALVGVGFAMSFLTLPVLYWLLT